MKHWYYSGITTHSFNAKPNDTGTSKGAQLMAVARKTLFVLLSIVTLLLVYVSWLILR
ncbi:MAG: hypothetical protein HP494_15605 [Nitrospira sp.]|nr:hypothetical protein [Nitrospira sp.]